MRNYNFSPTTNETQRDGIVIALRRAGFSASRETDTLRTDASRTAIGIVWGNALVVE